MLTISFLGAQEIVFTASAPNKVLLGKQFPLNYSVNSKADSIRITSFDSFKSVNGPSISTMSSVNIIGGHMIQKFETSFKYNLKATTKGKFTAPEASILVDGKRYYSNTPSIEVIDTVGIQNTDSTKTFTEKETFLDLTLSKKEVYPQEIVTGTIKIYSKYIVNRVLELKLPVFDDFIAYQSSDSIAVLKKDTINGSFLYSSILYNLLLYPQKSGMLIIDGGKLRCVILKPKKDVDYKDPFAIYFGDSYKEIEDTLVIAPQTLLVKPFPKPEPTDFSHICSSDINLTASINEVTIGTNTPLIYQITLAGHGNLKLASKPSLSLPVGLTEVASSVTSNVTNYTDCTIGSMTFSYTIIPTKDGHYIIPAYSTSYFDPTLKQYKRVSTQPLKVTVNKGNEKPFDIRHADERQTKDSSISGDVMVVMDVSGTMLAQDFKPNRIEASIHAVKKFITNQSGKVGLVVFSEGSRTICSLTSNLGVVADSLDKISTLQLGQGTAIGLGIGNAILELKKSTSKEKSIVLLTDGVNNSGSITTLLAAKMAASFGINLYLVGVASKDSTALYPYKTADTTKYASYQIDIDEQMMNNAASQTNGKYFRVTDSASFDTIFREIGLLVNTPRTNKDSNEMTKDEAQRVLNVISQEFENPSETNLKK